MLETVLISVKKLEEAHNTLIEATETAKNAEIKRLSIAKDNIIALENMNTKMEVHIGNSNLLEHNGDIKQIEASIPNSPIYSKPRSPKGRVIKDGRN